MKTKTNAKILSFILCLALTLSAALPVSAAELTMESDWRLTDTLDITDDVTFNGAGKYNIYEMEEGAGLNIKGGSVTLMDAELYPYADPAAGSLAELSERHRLAKAEAAKAATGNGSAAANVQTAVLAQVNTAIAAGGNYTAALEVASYDAATGVWNGTLTLSGGGNKAVSTTATGTYKAANSGGGSSGGGSGGGSSGGSSSSNGSSSSTPAASSAISVTGSAGSATANLPAALDESTGNVKITLGDSRLKTLTDGALAEAETIAPTLTLDLSSAAAKSVTLDVNTAKALLAAEVSLTLKFPAARITFEEAALESIANSGEAGATSVRVEAYTVDASAMSAMQNSQVEGYGAVLNIDVFVGEQKLDVEATLSLPYELNATENSKAVRVWYLGDDASLTKIDSTYNAETKLVTFTVNHQSYYVVGYDPTALWNNIFDDVDADAWYYDAVAYANYNGLFSGNGDGSFAPQGTMSRAMFAAVLWSMEGRPSEGVSAFSDVSADAWYAKAVAWAQGKGLFGGVGSITEPSFAPDSAINRQEMAAILYNFAAYKGYAIPKNREEISYADQNKIDAWAITAAAELSAAGVFSGDGSNFAPQRESTRAEVAQMFKAFQRLVAVER